LRFDRDTGALLMATAKTTRDLSAEIAYLTRALKAPTLREAVDRVVVAHRVSRRLPATRGLRAGVTWW
jgi:hypothetical protein